MQTQEKITWDGYLEPKTLEEFVESMIENKIRIMTSITIALSSTGHPQKVLFVTEKEN